MGAKSNKLVDENAQIYNAAVTLNTTGTGSILKGTSPIR